jgi:hypothetical protein
MMQVLRRYAQLLQSQEKVCKVGLTAPGKLCITVTAGTNCCQVPEEEISQNLDG